MNKPIKLKKGDAVSYTFPGKPKVYESEVSETPDYRNFYPLIKLKNGHEFGWDDEGYYSRDLGVYLIIKPETRTLQLTHEQIETLCHALGIAERQMTNIHRQLIDEIVNTRMTAMQPKDVIQYHQKACEFADLNIAIVNSDLDV